MSSSLATATPGSAAIQAPARRARLGDASSPALLLARLLGWLCDLHQPWREDLRSYDAHLLRDIGLTRAEALRIADGRR